MRKQKRGLSFLELLVAMTVTFLAISFLMGLFVSATRNSNRSKTFSTAGFLAQGKMEVLNATPLDQLVTGSDNFTGAYADYVYNVDVTDAGDYDGDGSPDPDLKLLTLTVTAPDAKTVSTLYSLRTTPEPWFGTVAHATNYDLAFMGSRKPGKRYVRGWDHSNGLDPTTLWPYVGAIRSMPSGGRPGAVASDPNLKTIWAVDFVNNGLRYFKEGQGNWSPQLLRPAGIGHPTGVAVCACASDNYVWIADDTNLCLWLYTDTPHLAGTWSAKITTAGLGRLGGVTCDSLGEEVYVADIDNDCVRHYSKSTNSWDPNKYKNPDNSMDGVQGVALTRDGSRLYVMDKKTLQWADVSTLGGGGNWTSVPLESKLEEDGPQGLSVTDDGKVVWAIASNGLLFRCDLTSFSGPGDERWEELGP